MAFTEHKITAFKHKIADLADQPNLPSNELKARFDSSPEELRLAHNNLCDDAARLDARVSGIITETFTDAIHKGMLSPELSAELDAKAEKTALDAEVTAREDADTKLTESLDALRTKTKDHVSIYVGTYTGNGSSSRTFDIPAKPRVLLMGSGRYQNILMVPQGITAQSNAGYSLVSLSGTKVNIRHTEFNESSREYAWIAIV